MINYPNQDSLCIENEEIEKVEHSKYLGQTTYLRETTKFLSSWFFAAAMASLRPQNLPLSVIYCKFYYFSWKILVFTIFKTQVVFFKWQSSESQHRPFLLLSHNSFKAPSLFKTVILKAVQSVFKLLLLPAVTLHLKRVLASFSFTLVTICAVIYFMPLVVLFLFSLPLFFSLLLDS